MKRGNPYNIFGSRPPKQSSNGHPFIWSPGAARPSINIPANVCIAAEDQVQLPQTPTDVFQQREGAGGMRVGRDFQARIPAFIPHKDKFVHHELDKALLVWCPTEKITEAELIQYLIVSKDKFNYSGEQALGLLYWHRYDIPKALQDLGNFTPHPEEWTIEDKVLFEQAYHFHGKAFERIRLMLPDKSMSSLIRYYYRWKKSRNKSSSMDRQARKASADEGSDFSATTGVSNSVPGPVGASLSANSHQQLYSQSSSYSMNLMAHQQQQQPVTVEDSDDDIAKKQNGEAGKCCGNCGVPSTELHSKDKMCYTCYLYFKKTGDYRPSGPLRRGDRQLLGIFRQKRSPPSGIFCNHDDLSMLASAPPQAENVTLLGLDKEVLDAKCRIQTMKQVAEILARNVPSEEELDQRKPKKPETQPRVVARWTNEELLLAAQGVRRYGKDFARISETVPTKTAKHVKSFYVNYKTRFGLDAQVAEHDLEKLTNDMVDSEANSETSTPVKTNGN